MKTSFFLPAVLAFALSACSNCSSCSKVRAGHTPNGTDEVTKAAKTAPQDSSSMHR